jgi:hypothetical protein
MGEDRKQPENWQNGAIDPNETFAAPKGHAPRNPRANGHVEQLGKRGGGDEMSDMIQMKCPETTMTTVYERGQRCGSLRSIVPGR